MTHEPERPCCADCMRAKMQEKSARPRRGAPLGPKPTKLGDQVTADTLLAFDEEDGGLNEEPRALIVLDRGIDYLDGFPLKDKTADSHHQALFEFDGPRDYNNELYTDMILELIKAAADAELMYSTSTPHPGVLTPTGWQSARFARSGQARALRCCDLA